MPGRFWSLHRAVKAKLDDSGGSMCESYRSSRLSPGMDGTKFKQGVTSFRLVVPGFHGIGIEGKAPTQLGGFQSRF